MILTQRFWIRCVSTSWMVAGQFIIMFVYCLIMAALFAWLWILGLPNSLAAAILSFCYASMAIGMLVAGGFTLTRWFRIGRSKRAASEASEDLEMPV